MATLTGDNGLLQKAQTAKEENEQAKEFELIKLAVSAAQVAGEGTIEEKVLNDELIANLGGTDTANKVGENWYYKGYVIEGNGNVKKYDKLLPKEYQQVEYIESAGIQYIDTKSRADVKTKVIFKYHAPSQQNLQQGIFGSRNQYNSQCFCIFTGNQTNALQSDYYYSDNLSQYTKNINGFDGQGINEIEMSNELKINGVLYNSLEPQNLNSNYSMFIFAIHNNGNPYFLGKIKIFYFKIFSGDTLISNFIPCYSTVTATDVDGEERSAGTVGLYDTVEGKFYTNQGTGTFGYGMEDGTYVAPTNN